MAEEITLVERFTVSREELEKALKQGDAIRELRDRVAALEAAVRAEQQQPLGMTTEDLFVVLSGINDMDRMNVARHLMRHSRIGPMLRAEQQATTEESSATEPAPADPDDRKWITDRRPVESEANFYGCVEVPASCRSSEPITHEGRRYTKFYMIKEGEPWLPASFDYHKSRQAIFDEGYRKGLAAARAEQQEKAAVKGSLTVQPEPMAAPAGAGRVATDEELDRTYDRACDQARDEDEQPVHITALRAVYDLGRQDAPYTCPHIRSSDEGTSYCALAEQPAPAEPPADPAPEPAPLPPIRVGQKWRMFDGTAVMITDCTYIYCYPNLAELIEDAPAPTEPAPLAPAGGLVGSLERAIGMARAFHPDSCGDKGLKHEIRGCIEVIATWLEQRQPTHETEPDSIDFAAYLLRMEATR